jgi:hypothetical protein
MSDADVIHLTLAGGQLLRVRKLNVIAGHEATASETHPGGKTKIYLSSGQELFVRDDVQDCVKP